MNKTRNRALDVGTAVEHIVCADIILSGCRAFMSAAGLPYDLIADVNGRLYRINVKSSSIGMRPAYEGNRVCYQFNMTKSGKNKTNPRGEYTVTDCDMLALVALDVRKVIYLPPINGTWVTSFHVDPPYLQKMNRSRNGTARKHWSDFPYRIQDALP